MSGPGQTLMDTIESDRAARLSVRALGCVLAACACWGYGTPHAECATPPARQPNILLAIADDLSFAHVSIAGYPGVRTPAFDRVAREGIWFRNAFSPSPGCSPTRAALLTGRHTWQIEQAGTHASAFPTRYVVYPDLLEQAGYWVGYTGKGWGPGNFQASGRTRNPAGPVFASRKLKPPHSGIGANDYAANFADFLERRPAGQPFCFWYGATEPHRGYQAGAGLESGKRLADAPPPPFLPDTPPVRSDILDYCLEVEWFDEHLGRMLKLLEKAGELDRTLVIVTSDNGMPFPRAKANLYEYGFHMPLAIRWGDRVSGGRSVDDLVGLVDVTATILDAAGVRHPGAPYPIAGRSFLDILTSGRQGTVDPTRTAVYAARERHSSSRYQNLSYPQRCLRTPEYLFIRNFRPDRWPAGDPQALRDDGQPGPMHGAYHDIDASPTLKFMVDHRDQAAIGPFFHLAVDKRPAEELFDVRADPGCTNNLAGHPDWAATKARLARQLDDYLRQTGDPRVLDGGEIWESYPRYSPIRSFPPPSK